MINNSSEGANCGANACFGHLSYLCDYGRVGQSISTPMESPIASSNARWPAYRRIAEGLRNEILTGKLTPGTQLPSTDDLAVIWQSSTFTIHSALVTLVKEGWVERLNGAGTYVAEIKNRFTCAGVYHGVDICSNEIPSFNRSIHGAVIRQLESLSKAVLIFVDSRPLLEQETVLPALAEAVLHRRIQCLIGATVNEHNSVALAELAIPTAFVGTPPTSYHRVNFDRISLFEESVRHLAGQGCRSIGLITHMNTALAGSGGDRLLAPFHKAIRREKKVTRDEWVRTASETILKLPPYGYEQFHQLWRLPEKPEGLIVYPDDVAVGVATAILEIGVQRVMDRMKLVFHRNAHIDFLCPFPVTWAVSDEDRMAAGLMEMIQKQFDGEKASPLFIPYVCQTEEAAKPLAPALSPAI